MLSEELNFEGDIKYFMRCIDFLPMHYVSADTNRMTLAYFCISGLDLLGKLDEIKDERKKEMINWIYAQLINAKRNSSDLGKLGFRGGPFTGAPYDPFGVTKCPVDDYDGSHLAMTYTALITLIILGDDLTRIDRDSILDSVKALQLTNGCFSPSAGNTESDMRFLFCACAISFVLKDWRAIDLKSAVEFIKKSLSFDGAFGQGPNQESHGNLILKIGGSTFCAVAALFLMDKLDALSQIERKSLELWCIQRQRRGFQGRIDKPEDTCYSFWIGASLSMLNTCDFINADALYYFSSLTHTKFGGFSKGEDDDYPDLLHSYTGLAGLSLFKYPGISQIHPALNISSRAFEWMKNNAIYWKSIKNQ